MSGHECQFYPVSTWTPTYFTSAYHCRRGRQTIKLQRLLHWPWGWPAAHSWFQRPANLDHHALQLLGDMPHHCGVRGLCLSKRWRKPLTHQLQDFSNHASTCMWIQLHTMWRAAIPMYRFSHLVPMSLMSDIQLIQYIGHSLTIN